MTPKILAIAAGFIAFMAAGLRFWAATIKVQSPGLNAYNARALGASRNQSILNKAGLWLAVVAALMGLAAGVWAYQA